MSFIKIKVQTNSEEGASELEVSLVVSSLELAIKPLMEPWILSLPGNTFQVPEIADESKFADAGMVLFDTVQGGKAYIKPGCVTGFFTPELGTYILVLNGSKLGVKATGQEVESKLTQE